MPYMTSLVGRDNGEWLDRVSEVYCLSMKYRPSMHGMRKLWCPEIVELIERMWAQEPRDRPTISDVVHDLGSILSKY